MPAEQTTSPPSAEQTTSLPAERTFSPPWSETTISLPAAGALAMGRKEKEQDGTEKREIGPYLFPSAGLLGFHDLIHDMYRGRRREGAPYIEKKAENAVTPNNRGRREYI